MADDIFKDSEFNFGGAFPANRGVINAIGGKLTGTLMQNLQVNYSQSVQKLYELGVAGQRTNVYYVGGKPSGVMQVGHLLGPSLALRAYFNAYTDVCQAGSNNIDLNISGQICGANGQKVPACSMNARFCVISNVGFNVATANMVVNVSSAVEFANLAYTGA